MQRSIWISAMLCIAVGCGKGGGAAAGGTDAVVDAWKKGGLEPSAFTVATTNVGKDCKSGTVNKVDVLVCTYASADEAKKAQDAGLQWVGDTTGASQAKGSLLISVADRRKADPTGRTINQMFKLAGN
ncbi:MAG: putative lipoprotein [Myxococcales bacterium]|nr:putative lipoprotein [Myxococcales bacterium]